MNFDLPQLKLTRYLRRQKQRNYTLIAKHFSLCLILNPQYQNTKSHFLCAYISYNSNVGKWLSKEFNLSDHILDWLINTTVLMINVTTDVELFTSKYLFTWYIYVFCELSKLIYKYGLLEKIFNTDHFKGLNVVKSIAVKRFALGWCSKLRILSTVSNLRFGSVLNTKQLKELMRYTKISSSCYWCSSQMGLTHLISWKAFGCPLCV